MRKFYNLSRDAFSEMLGISPSHLGLIERGERGTSIARFVEISTKLHVSLDYLLAGRGSASEDVAGCCSATLQGILDDYSLQKLTDFAKLLALCDHSNEETDRLFDALRYFLLFYNTALKSAR
jgi:transcriptional regulator with XRE-family HTH domain